MGEREKKLISHVPDKGVAPEAQVIKYKRKKEAHEKQKTRKGGKSKLTGRHWDGEVQRADGGLRGKTIYLMEKEGQRSGQSQRQGVRGPEANAVNQESVSGFCGH